MEEDIKLYPPPSNEYSLIVLFLANIYMYWCGKESLQKQMHQNSIYGAGETVCVWRY